MILGSTRFDYRKLEVESIRRTGHLYNKKLTKHNLLLRARAEEERIEQRRAQMQEEEAQAGNLVEEAAEGDEDGAEEEAEEVEMEEFE